MAVKLPQLDAVKQLTAVLAAGEAPGAVEAIGVWGGGKAALTVQVADELGAPLLVLTPSRIEAENVIEDLATFAGSDRCALFPAWEVLPTDAMDPADDIVAERMETLKRLDAATRGGNPLHVVLSVRALLQYVVRQDRLKEQSLALQIGEEHDLEDLLTHLISMGYRRELMVEQRGEMSVRGGIFDIFPISAELPYRLEFFGDEIESIRRFEPETQRSVDQAESLDILPRSEKELLRRQAGEKGALAAITEYFPANTLVVIDEPLAVVEEGCTLSNQLANNAFCMSWEEALAGLSKFRRISMAQLPYQRTENVPRVNVAMHAVSGWTGNLPGFWSQLREWDAAGFSVIVICNNTGERRRLHELLEEQGYKPGDGAFDLRLEIGQMSAGFLCGDDRLVVFSEREIFGRHYVRRVRRRFEAGAAITAFSDLKTGDYIVHDVHGIGRYEGLRRFAGKGGDFLAIRYSGGDTLYVPVTEIDQVQKYVAGEGGVPKVDRLGGATWTRTKTRVKKVVRDMTEELVKLYAARESQRGHAFNRDTPWQFEFEDAFEYDETPDQARAIVETKADMEAARPMDRLICGDVGFGKTEVALRAAFKAVMDGRQVAVLVPTTVLAQQHYLTFSERLADYPVRVEVLSRFQSPKQIKGAIEGLKAGEVDIIIGTHRLISKDVQFKNLGLVVIDEEQRFGVGQKEKLKHLRTHVDVLTMSATPIPRTLHFSLMGIRDMSIINTAPNDRLPIHTCIEAFDETLVQEAIRRELAREGQVFFLHNRVQTIVPVANLVHKLVPEARVTVAHGQMPEGQLEHIMSAFIRHEIDVLVCTTIIGSGLDIPNANTIIIDRADRFGLAELYQIRGRVGRYKHRAFAYLLVPGDRVPTEDAQKRLKALEEFSALGAGYRIAMRDLEIRGCGNILGAEQHGQIAAVGYDTYSRLIREAVAELRGEAVVQRVLPPFEVAVDAFIPEEYVPSEAQKMTLYKRIAGILTVEQACEMREELTDRFGRPPGPVVRLLDVMRVRALGADAGAAVIAASKEKVTVQFENSQRLAKKVASTLKEEFGRAVEFSWQDRPGVTLKLGADSDLLKSAEDLLKALTRI
jgi:transcription-repair coupling factor (superfamily II helicase)